MGLIELQPTRIYAVLGLSDADLKADLERGRKRVRRNNHLLDIDNDPMEYAILPRARTLADLQAVTRKGLPSSVIDALRDLGFTLREISQATAIPARTLVRRASEKRLTIAESNQFVRIASFLADAPFLESRVLMVSSVEMLRAAFAGPVRWLRTANQRLGKAPPLTLLDTDAGAAMVCEALAREHDIKQARATLAASGARNGRKPARRVARAR